MKRLGDHALGVALLFLAGTLVHHAELFSATPLADEAAYVCAARAESAQLPLSTCPRYLYTPGFARVLGTVLEQAGEAALLGGLRLCVWLGAAVTLWLSLALSSWSWQARVVAGVLAMSIWPPLTQALTLGNLSSVVAAATVSALLLKERQALLAGWLLGVAILIKPLPAAVPLLLLAHAAGELWRGKRSGLPELRCGLVALAIVGLGVALGGGIAPLPPFDPAIQNSITLVRTLRVLGIGASPLTVCAAAAMLGAFVAARWEWPVRRLGELAVVISLLSAPLVWAHSWLLSTPLLVLALERALARYRDAPDHSAERKRGMLELLLVMFAALALSFSDAFGAVALGSQLNALFILAPLLTPSALFFYLARRA